MYESAPSSPKRQPLALPPAKEDGTAISLGQWRGRMPPTAMPSPQSSPQSLPVEISKPNSAGVSSPAEPEEGTPEFIRRRYFPGASANDPNLAWMQGSPFSTPADQASASLRFDLSGKIVPTCMAVQLPTHLGLHHHSEGSMAGYTLDDIFLLSRSTVPAQRAAMLGVLASIVLNLGKAVKGDCPGLEELLPRAEDFRRRIMAAGVEAMNERGSVGIRAIEVVWASIVGWDEEQIQIKGVELQKESDASISSLQFDFFLPQIVHAFLQGDIPLESSNQLLAILHCLAKQNNKIAETVLRTPNLLATILYTFLQIPTSQNGRQPEPAAIEFLITLVSASRYNAEALGTLQNTEEVEGHSRPRWLMDLLGTEESNGPQELERPASILLRFITMLPPSSLLPSTQIVNLLTLSMHFYCALASYGLCSNIAKIAVEPLSHLGQYVTSSICGSQALQIAWLDLQSMWTVCAIDPHKTTPVHDLLWSQVVGWLWKDEVVLIAQNLGDREEDWKLWDAVWRAEAQWLEGCKINSTRGGETERLEFLERSGTTFSSGIRGQVVIRAIDALRSDLEADDVSKDLRRCALHAGLLKAAMQVWLASLPPHLDGPPPSPPFDLPFPAISAISAKLVTHPLWDSVRAGSIAPKNYVHARQLSGLLNSYLLLSRRLPGISEELWVAQALSILSRLMPGDEKFAMSVVERLSHLIDSHWVNGRNIISPKAIWDRGGLAILQPFFSHAILPRKTPRVAPLQPAPESIANPSTLRLPMSASREKFGLPLSYDWSLTPLDHLLRSADSEVFKNLPPGWDSSELEITRATLFFSNLCRDILARFSLDQFLLSREETVFGCMKVFMLEHGHMDSNLSIQVFRDSIVEKLMMQLLDPFSHGKAVSQPLRTAHSLEEVATKFLGRSTPFYQFYTDFVALYDAISFSETTFAKLLLPPTSMQYAPDYRKHLWVDFNHIIKTIHTPYSQVLSSDLREYLYPIENDSQLIAAFLRAILKGPLEGFVRLVAVHHIASNIWQDLQNEGPRNKARAEKLIKAVVGQGNNDTVREVISYRQKPSGSIWVPPVCFESSSEVAGARLAWIRELGDTNVISCVERSLL